VASEAEGVMALVLIGAIEAQYLGLMQVTDVRKVVVPTAWLEERPMKPRAPRARVVSFILLDS